MPCVVYGGGFRRGSALCCPCGAVWVAWILGTAGHGEAAVQVSALMRVQAGGSRLCSVLPLLTAVLLMNKTAL